MKFRTEHLLFGIAGAGLLASAVWLGLDTDRAVREYLGPNRLVIPLQLERGATTQLYYDIGEGLSEADSVIQSVPASDRLEEVVFPVPRQPISVLRFDPAHDTDAALAFRVGAPHLENATGRLVAEFPLSAVVTLNQIGELTTEGDVQIGEIEANANDPQLLLGLGAPLRIGAVRLPGYSLLVFAITLGASLGLLIGRPGLRRDLGGAWTGCREFLNRNEIGVRHPALTLAIGAVLVLGIQFWELWPLQRSLDLPLWDEVNYAARGAAWWKEGGALGALHSSPLYAAAYGLLSSLGGLAQSIYLQHYVVKLLTTVLLFVGLARWWQSRAAAAAIALLWALTTFQLQFPLLVYHFAWIGFLAAIALLDLWPVAAVALLALATLGRQEYEFAPAAVVIGLALTAWRRHWTWRRWLSSRSNRLSQLAGGTLAAVAALLALGIGWRTSLGSSFERAWFAFQQHYALRAVTSGEEVGLNPWADFAPLIQRDFGDASSLGEALSRNPSAVFHHLTYNLTHLPTAVAGMFAVGAGLRLPALLLVLFAVAVLLLRRPPAATSRPPGMLIVAATAITLLPGILIYAKDAFLLPLVPVLLAGAGSALQWAGGRLRLPRAPTGALAALAVLVAFSLIQAPRAFATGLGSQPVAETVRALDAIWPRDRARVLLGVSASSYAQYLGPERCLGIEPLAGVSGGTGQNPALSELLDRYDPDALLVTDDWRNSADFDPTELARVTAAEFGPAISLPAGTLYLRAR